ETGIDVGPERRQCRFERRLLRQPLLVRVLPRTAVVTAELHAPVGIALAHVPGEAVGRPSLDVAGADARVVDLATARDEHDLALGVGGHLERSVDHLSRDDADADAGSKPARPRVCPPPTGV